MNLARAKARQKIRMNTLACILDLLPATVDARWLYHPADMILIQFILASNSPDGNTAPFHRLFDRHRGITVHYKNASLATFLKVELPRAVVTYQNAYIWRLHPRKDTTRRTTNMTLPGTVSTLPMIFTMLGIGTEISRKRPSDLVNPCTGLARSPARSGWDVIAAAVPEPERVQLPVRAQPAWARAAAD